jgi:triphosphoribosyl-dephospho-CoA synthetase
MKPEQIALEAAAQAFTEVVNDERPFTGEERRAMLTSIDDVLRLSRWAYGATMTMLITSIGVGFLAGWVFARAFP